MNEMNDLISRAVVLRMLDENSVVFRGEIEKIPAVNAAPVVHGYWIETMIPKNTTGYGGIGQDKKKGWLCSECRCAFDAKLLWCDNYCPNCGSKNREDKCNIVQEYIV